MNTDIYEMKLHETIELKNTNESTYTYVKRVAGGWIYSQGARNEHNQYVIHTSVFVEYNNEFQKPYSGDF